MWPFFSICRTSIMSVIGLDVCCVSRMCCEYFEFGLFDCIDCMFFVPSFEISTCLSYVLLLACVTFHLIYAISFDICHFI
jgi:hypothetical protein